MCFASPTPLSFGSFISQSVMVYCFYYRVEEWINRNNAAMAAAVTESDVKSARKSQRSMSSSASPRAAAKNSR